MNRNEQFLTHFENIEAYIRRVHNYSRDPLSKLVNTTKDATIRVQRQNLEVLMLVRNALLHNGVDNYVEVTQEVIDLADEVYQALPLHKRAKDYMTKNPICFDMDDSIAEPLQVISKSKLIRFPIFDNGRIVGILSDNGISHWLAENIENDIVSIKSTTIRDVALHDEYFYDIHYVSDESSYSYVYSVFEKTLGLRMVLVTDNGKPNERVLGVITRGDILK